MPRTDRGGRATVTTVPVAVETSAPGGTTNAYVVEPARHGRPSHETPTAGRNALLIDPAARSSELDAAIAEVGVGDGNGDGVGDFRVEAIAVTHAHPDHVGAVAEYADETNATVYAHARHIDRFTDAVGVEPDETFRDGDELGGTGVVALETPGHAPDHAAFDVDGGMGDLAVGGASGATRASRILVGDLAFASGSVAVAAPDGNVAAYLESLRRIIDAEPGTLYPGHGPVITEPTATCRRLVEHRLERERRVLEAIEGGASDVEAVLEAAYEKDLTGVEALARATVIAHVEMLVSDGRIEGSWTDR